MKRLNQLSGETLRHLRRDWPYKGGADRVGGMPFHDYIEQPGLTWPWEPEWWKPGDRVRMLVKAGALIAAEIDRIQRANGET